jgi:hypothetical protein
MLNTPELNADLRAALRDLPNGGTEFTWIEGGGGPYHGLFTMVRDDAPRVGYGGEIFPKQAALIALFETFAERKPVPDEHFLVDDENYRIAAVERSRIHGGLVFHLRQEE